MAVEASPYATLGLEPGADWATIERTYRELIKRHHPDRAGGDAARAAEITRAYRELKRERVDGKALVLAEDSFDVEPRRRGWLAAALVGAAAAVLVLTASGPLAALFDQRRHASERQTDRPAAGNGDLVMAGPLSSAAIDRAIADAVRIARGQDEMALAAHSRDCHRELRLRPSLRQFDRCAAFDDAVVEIQDRDPLRDQGPFGELAVTGRQMTAGTLLSNDYLAIDGRLDRVRLQVELALAPPLPPPEVAVPETNAETGD